MKKLFTVIVLGMFIICFIYSSCFYSFKTYTTCLTIDEQTQTLTIGEEDNLKILQLTDIQFTGYLECAPAFNLIKKIVAKASPDMIVITGDNVSNNSSQATLSAFIDFFDSFNLPWLPVFGNHDRSSNVSPSEICEQYENSKNCLFKTGNLQNSYGNYVYNIKRGDNLIYSLFLMDSNTDNFTTEQVEWYETQVNNIKSLNNNITLPSLAFFHIPVVEVQTASDLYDKGQLTGTGDRREEVCEQDVNTGFFDKVLELGSTKALIYGHDHINDTILEYNGVTLCYGLKSARTCYYDNRMLGGNLITINTSNQFSIDRIFVN